jgi:hypothetical protein
VDTITGKGATGLLTPLFEARLQLRSDMEVVSAETQEGELIGSGDGTVTGASISGTVCLSMYAGNCTYVGCRELDFGPHLGNTSAPFIRLASSKRLIGPRYGLTPGVMCCDELTRANPICGWSRWRCSLRQRTGATSG